MLRSLLSTIAGCSRPALFSLLLLTLGLASPGAWAAPVSDSGGRAEVGARAGDLALQLRREEGGIRLRSLRDLAQDEELSSTNRLPLFSLTLRELGSKRETHLEADEGWRATGLRRTREGLEARWSNPADTSLDGSAVVATARSDARANAWHWQIRVENHSANWSIWRVSFPQLAMVDFGAQGNLFVPRGPGEVQRALGDRTFTYTGKYTDAWCTMQFLANYRDGERPTGLYVATHDPWGSYKQIVLLRDPGLENVRLRFEHPAPDMGRKGNGFVLSGEAVWQLLRGDWFDAAQIYKAWARREARWWPRLNAEGRADTPRWMRELNVWAQASGGPNDCVARVQEFQKFLGLPVGFHWYGWHQIPGDNDYPHYFPAVANFERGVQELQRSPIYVMPYINGRLWDVLDQGTNDWEFSRLGLPGATKKEDGQPYLETYASKESNGEKVHLAVMCPTTPIWQQTVSNLVLRLLSECGNKSVYIDQVAAATPMLCMDPAHGHPLGGGHWWNEGYWQMLDSIRRAMPPGSMLTSECNGEPFIRWFDGFLTWTWHHRGLVPAFPAVYAGTVQTFGRAYGGGESKDLALRMRAAQELVFGEQLGWLDPGIVHEKDNADFFKRAVKTRARFNQYFVAGEMARPPKLLGNIPSVYADWQWSGHWWVTNDAVYTGSWQLPKAKRQILLFANVSDQPVSANLRFDPFGRARKFSCQTSSDGEAPVEERRIVIPPKQALDQPVVLPPRRIQAWELRW